LFEVVGAAAEAARGDKSPSLAGWRQGAAALDGGVAAGQGLASARRRAPRAIAPHRITSIHEGETMKRILTFLAALALGALAAGPAAAQATSAAKERVIIQVSTPEQRTWNQALNYVENLQTLYGKDNVQIEIVALGWGIGLLKFDSPMATRVADAIKRGATLQACEVTMGRQKLTRQDMLPDIGYVPAGLGQIIQRQKEGWSYISG
jgi:intracellular sulfur oxidation DsrE/DsrF family protein